MTFFIKQSKDASDKICGLIARQKAIGKIDGVAVGRIVNQIEQEQLLEMEAFYSKLIELLSYKAQERVLNFVDNAPSAANYMIVDYASLAVEIPQVVYNLFEGGCSRSTE